MDIIFMQTLRGDNFMSKMADIRKKKGLTQEQIAKVLGIPRTKVIEIENEEQLSDKMLSSVANALEISEYEIMSNRQLIELAQKEAKKILADDNISKTTLEKYRLDVSEQLIKNDYEAVIESMFKIIASAGIEVKIFYIILNEHCETGKIDKSKKLILSFINALSVNQQ